jgi:DNA modification methylase
VTAKPWTIHTGDCVEVLKTLGNASVDAVVTDPPYGLSFMGKRWDYDVPTVEVWAECLRVLKPGGHLLAFAGTRTQHRMAVRIEDAGFEIRDMIAWVYGSGFPKSLDVSKAIDKMAGAEREVLGSRTKAGIGGSQTFAQDAWTQANRGMIELPITAPATDAARRWSGWGTALKPAMEPITVARKPLIGTVAQNVLAHGTGAINVDGGRVGTGGGTRMVGGPNMLNKVYGRGMGGGETEECGGRWPANLIHDGSGEVLERFPEQAGSFSTTPGSGKKGVTGWTKGSGKSTGGVTTHDNTRGSAARFFYCAKASRTDRNDGDDNKHPTVKPTDLMRYLCRLVTPLGGLILDPFMGSGSTGRGAILEGFRFIGIEREAEYVKIAEARIQACYEKKQTDSLFL